MGLLYDYHVLLTIGFVKGTRGNVKKAEPKLCLIETFDIIQLALLDC